MNRRFGVLLTALVVTAIDSYVAKAQSQPSVTTVMRTDSVPEKVDLLQQAYSQGNFDLAMSLAESIKDTLALDRQTKQQIESSRIGADRFLADGEVVHPIEKHANLLSSERFQRDVPAPILPLLYGAEVLVASSPR